MPALTSSRVAPVQEPARGTSSRNFPAFLLSPGIHLVIAVSSEYISVSVSINVQTKTNDRTNYKPLENFALSSALLLDIVGKSFKMSQNHITSFQSKAKIGLERFLNFDLISVGIFVGFYCYVTYKGINYSNKLIRSYAINSPAPSQILSKVYVGICKFVFHYRGYYKVGIWSPQNIILVIFEKELHSAPRLQGARAALPGK